MVSIIDMEHTSKNLQVPLEYALNTTVDDLNISAALCFAFLAIGCILLQPTAMKIGRRPVYILGTFLNAVGCIIGGFQNTVEVYYVVNVRLISPIE